MDCVLPTPIQLVASSGLTHTNWPMWSLRKSWITYGGNFRLAPIGCTCTNWLAAFRVSTPSSWRIVAGDRQLLRGVHEPKTVPLELADQLPYFLSEPRRKRVRWGSNALLIGGLLWQGDRLTM